MKNMKVGEIVAENIKYAEVFYRHNIDFCCKGNISLEEAAKVKNVDLEQITTELQAINGIDDMTDYRQMSSEALIKDIIETHHEYIRENKDMIKALLKKVVSVHGDNHPELQDIYDLYNESIAQLSLHMENEEVNLFPRILKHINGDADGQNISSHDLIEQLKQEHSNEGDRFEHITVLSDNFTPPADACNTYKFVFNKLDEFQKDLHRHIHKENNILFPRVAGS